MTTTPSRLLKRLEAEIAAATDPVAADCLRAERATYLARQGQLTEAAEELEAIRQRHSRRPNVSVSAWVSLAEGIFIHFSEVGAGALDKLKRAYALSTAANLPRLRSISAAWLAHFEYLSINVDRFVEFSKLALETAENTFPDATLRASMVIALALHLAGEYRLAKPWYERTRQLATMIGDSQAISAIIHNSAWLWACSLRYPNPDPILLESKLQRARLNVESSASFDDLIGASGLMDFQPLLRGFVLASQGHFESAADAYRNILASASIGKLGNMGSVFFADLSYCEVRLGNKEAALDLLSKIDNSYINGCPADDRAMTWARMSDIFMEVRDFEVAKDMSLRAREAWCEHSKYQLYILKRIRESGLMSPLRDSSES